MCLNSKINRPKFLVGSRALKPRTNKQDKNNCATMPKTDIKLNI